MPPGYRPEGHHHMVSAGHSLAARAADEILAAGGNAVDAGVAGGLALGVVQSDYVNVAGVAPIMVRRADGRAATIDGVGCWPAEATPGMFERDHGGSIPRGILRCVVPAAPSAWIEALRRFGTMRFHEVAAPAVRLARDGFAMHWLMHRMIAQHEADYAEWPANAAIYLPGGRVPEIGERFVQADLAATLQYMAAEDAARPDRTAGLAAARGAFYEGDIARAIAECHAAEGGLLRREDLATYASRVGTPIETGIAEGRLLCSGAYCQGPFLGQVMALLERFDWAGVDHGSSGYYHRVIEAVKIAFADREAVLGDPDYVDVPLDRLLSGSYLDARAALFDAGRALPDMPQPGMGEQRGTTNAEHPPAPGDTSYIAVVDSDGLAFSSTPSDVSYNSPVVPGTGLCPSPRGSASWADPTHPSSVAPGKRPRLTPNPAIWAGADGAVMPFGTPGGDVQIQAMAQFLLNHLRFGMDLQAAAMAPRVASYSFPSSFAPHESHPGLARIEARAGEAVQAELSALGHRVERWEDWTHLAGAICAVARAPDGRLDAAADQRRPTGATGW